LGQVISPIAVGLLSDHVFTQADGLLKSSIAVGLPCLFLAATTLRFAERHVLNTVHEVQTSSRAT
jgi:hypothetical protein